ncbi:hypothetical protein OE88DRAFT_1733272 [Heliocybe sulcata]|uniref:Uncharacterized protein n=1 Tax=Heliocybe sulcata TaxID=5364 RepID=A0A5C3NIB5_9AGAM|nr:hypothetical protein OE88DRAFT_1733272 [Heliocybe sulcata]
MFKPFLDPPAPTTNPFKVFRETSNTPTRAPSHVMPSTNEPLGLSAQNNSPFDMTKSIKVPSMVLAHDRVTTSMAATLALSLFGHVLFLKGQIPFPIAQMMRMSASQAESRSTKKRQDLLNSFDTLSSHLQTTFTMLSTALAKRASPQPKPHERDGEQAHIMIVLGPSVNAANSRVVLVLGGLEVRLWEEQDDRAPQNAEAGYASEGSAADSDDDEEESDADVPPDSDDESSASSPPLSRSPSPSPSAFASSPPSSPAPPTPVPRSHFKPSALPLSDSPNPRSTPILYRPAPSEQSHAEEQHHLRAAERLLARTLANACAEEEGGMSSELAPTQAHVLLRAPRRFAHPAWTPRQMWTSALEHTLSDFLLDSGIASVPEADVNNTSKKRSRRKGVKTEGVFVGCQGTRRMEEEEEGQEEEDEMIWWSWNGRLVGFSDW